MLTAEIHDQPFHAREAARHTQSAYLSFRLFRQHINFPSCCTPNLPPVVIGIVGSPRGLCRQDSNIGLWYSKVRTSRLEA